MNLRVLVSLLALATTSAAADELSLAHFVSTTHPMHADVFVPLAQQVDKATNGAVKLRIFPSGELGQGPNQQYDRAARGVADMTFGLPGYTSTVFRRTLLLEMPGVLPTDASSADKVWKSIDLFRPDFQRVELLGLWTAAAPTIVATSKKPVRKLEDLKGMTIRAPSAIAAEFLKAWGANAVTMPASELYTSLETGVIDGVLIGPDGIKSFRLDQLVKYVTKNFPGGMSTFYLVGNRDNWRKVPAQQRAALESVFGQALSKRASEAYQNAADQAVKLLEADRNIEMITLPDSEVQRIVDAAKPQFEAYLASLKSENIDGDAILAAIKR